MITHECASWNSSSSCVLLSNLLSVSLPLGGSALVEFNSFDGGIPFIKSSFLLAGSGAGSERSMRSPMTGFGSSCFGFSGLTWDTFRVAVGMRSRELCRGMLNWRRGVWPGKIAAICLICLICSAGVFPSLNQC